MISPGQVAYKQAFEVSPITLTGGIAGRMPGGALPISHLLNPGGSVLAGPLGEAFGAFFPIPGTSLIENQVGEYPFANQAVAANAVVKQPLNVSLLMRAPAKGPGGYERKLSIMTALQNTLANHIAQGGLFTVATQSYFYTGCILVGMHDVGGGETMQPQVDWRFDFRRPLISTGELRPALSTFMRRLEAGAMVSTRTTGRNLATPATAGSPGILPASATALSAGVPGAA